MMSLQITQFQLIFSFISNPMQPQNPHPPITNQKARQLILSLKKNVAVKALKVPVKKTNHYHKKIKLVDLMFEPQNVQKILSFGESKDYKLILLSKDFTLEKADITEEEKGEVEVKQIEVMLNHENYSNQEIFNIFQEKFPPQQKKQEFIAFPNSFETAGHIAHYNLTPQQSYYAHIIGEITLMRCPNIQTVVNKTEKLHNVYRTPTLEHMAGQEGKYLVKMKEVGTSFQLDFQKVYWCSRLQQERDRLLKIIHPQQCLADIFCGVGPLAVRAARQQAYVIANDLNPHCYEYLLKNAKSNKVQDRMICWNMCAREAMKKIYREHQTFRQELQYPDHIYMNLPVDAIQFLDVLKDYHLEMKTDKMPLVHVNCFVVADSDELSRTKLSERIEKVLPGFREDDIEIMHHIKNVTVIMRMYCVSFRLRNDYKQGKKQRDIKNKQGDDVVDRVQKKRKMQ